MSPDSIQLVHNTWALTTGHRDRMATLFYERLFEIAPDQWALFAQTDMVVQRERFVTMIDTIVRALDTPELLVPELKELAERHIGYGVRQEGYPPVGQALVHALEVVLPEAFSIEARNAWEEAYLITAAVMLRVYERRSH